MRLVMVSGSLGCVDKDTEFFNGVEWKSISDFKEEGSVLQYTKEGNAELVKPLAYIKKQEDYLWHFKNNRIDQCLSDEHDIVYVVKKKIYKKSFKEIKERHINSVMGFSGKLITTFSYNGKGISLTDNEIKLMCAIICDASFPNNNNKCFFNLKKERKKIELRKLLKEMNYHFEEREYLSMLGYTRFLLEAPIKEKFFSSNWYNCTSHQLNIICENIIKWDGSIRNESIKSYNFSTTNKQTADFIQFCFSACGYRVSIRVDDRIGQNQISSNRKVYKRKSISYDLTISKSNTLVSLGHNTNKDFFRKYKTLDGFKYCFNVPSGMLILRRNNRIFITGNSGKDEFYEKSNTLINNISRIAFADPLKKLARKEFNWNGNKDNFGRQLLIDIGQSFRGELVNILIDDSKVYKEYIVDNKLFTQNFSDNNSFMTKEEILNFYSLYKDKLISIRKRYNVHKNYWVDLAYFKMLEIDSINPNAIIINTDFRFISEIERLQELIGKENIITVRIDRNVANEKAKIVNDRTELELMSYNNFDYTIDNNSDLNNFHSEIFKFWNNI